jgi:hypothetical protein
VSPENRVILEAQEKLEKEEPPVFRVRGAYLVIRVFVEIRVIRVKEENKEREDYRANKANVEIVANKVRRGQLERKEFQVIRDPEEIKVSAAIREQMEILDQLENRDCKENQVKKDYPVIEENKEIKVREDIEVIKTINYKIIIFY